jgi:general stress protein YciG
MRDDERNGQEGRGGTKTARNGAGSGMSREEAARKGGEAVSQNRDHMASIGRKGGEAVSRNREHMAEIGRLGAEARNAQRNRGGRNDGGRGEQENGQSDD